MIKACNKIIEYSFYALFLLLPLVFTGNTSELFEFNKMWLTFILTIIITASWLIKMVLQKRIILRKTPIDLPILLFLTSQIISTIHSLDTHVSLWGYYSRFNGGLLSIISYIILFYASVSNCDFAMVKRLIKISLISGIIVALWGLPSHFGYDPTCFLFRGTFDVSCWTNAFQPKVRIFSTLGQPDWLGAYLALLLPISIALIFNKFNLNKPKFNKKRIFCLSIPLITLLFYIDLNFTGSKSAFLGFWAGVIPLLFLFFMSRRNLKTAVLISCIFTSLLITTLFAGQTFIGADKSILTSLKILNASKPAKSGPSSSVASVSAGELGGTNSGKIRLIVWKGAIDIWRHNPIFGTGVETFAFAYYKYKPKEHNLTSEWDFLYNKAHNEYLNYLANTGILGLGSYLLMIGSFLFISIKKISKSKSLTSNQAPNQKPQLGQLEIMSIRNLILALLASYLSILVSNFFGFSVVIINIYLFLIPAWVLILMDSINPVYLFNTSPSYLGSDTVSKISGEKISPPKQLLIMGIAIFSLYLIYSLIVFWVADTNYAMGYNLDHANQYQTAYPLLISAVSQRGDEPTFKDELSQNEATLALLSAEQKQATQASVLTSQAVILSNDVVTAHPNNVVFWKSRTRVFYTLSQFNPKYLSVAIESLQKAHSLAPTDVKISYDLGVLYGQTGDDKKAIEFLKQTIFLKPDYRDAYFALGLFYHDMAINKRRKVVNRELQTKAVSEMNEILTKFSSNDAEVKKTLQSWQNL